MAIDKKLICFARLEEFERQLAAGNILDKSIVFLQDANKIYNRGTYYDCQSPYVLPFDIETLDGLSYSDNEGRLQTDADVFEKAKSAIEMGRMVVIRYGLSDAGYHICDATYNGDAISVRVYNGLMLYSFEIYASSQGSIVVEQYSLQSELVDGVNIATINGQSLTAGGDLTIEGGADIIVTNESDLDELYKDVPEGTKAVVVNEANDILGVNLFDFFTGTIEGVTEIVGNPNAYTLKISSVDTSVELPISNTSDVSVILPFNNNIKIEMGSDLSSVSRILVQSGYSEVVWQYGRWLYVDMYLVDNEMPVLKLLNLDDNAFTGLMIIAPALIVDFVGAKTITEYIKNGDNWEIWSEGESVLNTKLDAWCERTLQEIPTKTSQLENDSNFITSEDVAAVALSGSYNDLQDTPTIPSAVTESTVSGWGFTKNTGTYSKPSGGIPKSDLASAVQTSLGKADTALQSYTEQYKGTVTGVKINGTTKNPSSGVVDLGTVITDVSNLVSKDFTGELITAQTQALQGGGLVYALPDQANGDEDDILLSKNTVKTINGESILGSGDIEISGGGVSEDYVNTAIANAITTTLNTAV